MFSPLTLLFVLGRAADPIETQRASVKHPPDSGQLGAPMGQMSRSYAVCYGEQFIGLGLMRSEWNWRDTRGGGNRAAREIGGISAKK